MRFWDWIKDFFGDKSTIYLDDKANESREVKLAIEAFAIASGINLIASAISKCEFKTFFKGQEVKQDEHYLWNIEPNKNQNSSQFIQEFITKLIFNGESLVIDVNGQLIVADSFNQTEYACFENIFTNVSKGTMSFNKTFKMSEVMYFKLGNTDIRALLSRLFDGYNDLINTSIDKYKRSGGRKGILNIDSTATGDKNFQQKFDDLMNNRFKKYFEAENAVLPLQKGFSYNEQNGDGNKKTNEISDIQNLTKEAFERVAQALKIPPALLKGDIADVDKITNNFLTFCIDPICSMTDEEITRKRYGKAAYVQGSYIKIDTTCIKHIDIFSIAEQFDKLIASGGYSIDELRIKAGDLPLNKPWSQKHVMTKNYADIEVVQNAKGGED